MEKTQAQKIYNDVYGTPTAHKMGFNSSEVKELLKKYPDLNQDKFDSALRGITCFFSEETGVIIYHCDIELALHCGLDNREPTSLEWD